MEIDFDGEAAERYADVPCPRCFRPLACVGTIAVHGADPTAVYQCDECVTPFRLGDWMFEAAYTFTLDPAGRPVDHQLGSDPSFN